jgi:hypothetical protein
VESLSAAHKKIERMIVLLSASPEGEARCRCRKVWLTRNDYYYYQLHMLHEARAGSNSIRQSHGRSIRTLLLPLPPLCHAAAGPSCTSWVRSLGAAVLLLPSHILGSHLAQLQSQPFCDLFAVHHSCALFSSFTAPVIVCSSLATCGSLAASATTCLHVQHVICCCCRPGCKV